MGEIEDARQAILKKASEEAVPEIAEFILSQATENLNQGIPESNGPITNTGFLAGTGETNIEEEFSEVIFSAAYAGDIEYGRRPGEMPPKKPVKKWVRTKLGITDEKKLERVTYLVRRKILNEGVPAQPFFRRSIEQAKDRFK